MGIIGLTHSETGAVIERLPVSVKVSIGTGPDPRAGQSGHPQKLDHFLLQRKIKRDKDVLWEADEHLHGLYGDEPGKPSSWYVQSGKIKEVGIVLLDDNVENVFRTSLAWWKATECHCRGELVQTSNNGDFAMQAVRRTPKHPEGEPWPGSYVYKDTDKKGKPVEPCGDACPDLDRGDCKPSGDLYFCLDKEPMVGAVCRLHTTSYRSIRQIHSGIQQIRKLTGGRLAGIRAMLKVRPEKITYQDESGAKKTSTAWILSIEISARDMAKLLDNMTEAAKLFQETRKLLGAGRVEVIEDDEPIRAREVAAEFYPENGTEETTQAEKITDGQWQEMWKVARAAWGNGKDEEIMKVIQSFGFEKSKAVTTDRYKELCARLKEGPPKPTAPAKPETEPLVPKAQIPPMREPGEDEPEEEEFTLTAPTEVDKPEPAKLAEPPKPKDLGERADALAAQLGIEPKQFKAFCAAQCGVASVTKAPKGMLTAVVTAVEKFVNDAGAEMAKPVVLGDPQANKLAQQALKSWLFDELKAVKK